MLNRIILVGRLTKDAELRKTNSDVSVATFYLAIDNSLKEADGTRGTCFLTCKIFGDQADNVCKYTRKGSKIGIDGSINQRNFLRQDGSKGHVIEVCVDLVEFLDPKPLGPCEEAEEVEAELVEAGIAEPQEEPLPWKYDPVSGKPLKPKAKK